MVKSYVDKYGNELTVGCNVIIQYPFNVSFNGSIVRVLEFKCDNTDYDVLKYTGSFALLHGNNARRDKWIQCHMVVLASSDNGIELLLGK